jgi:hypothetical protein
VGEADFVAEVGWGKHKGARKSARVQGSTRGSRQAEEDSLGMAKKQS